MRRKLALLMLTAAVILGIAAPVAGAAEPLDTLFNQGSDGSCPEREGGLEVCSAQVKSFDGSNLDVDVTLPMNDNGSKRHPVMIMLHGFGNNKHEWESKTDEGDGRDKYHWNSRWFAKHGYYVLTYTARGFRNDGENADYQPNTEEFTSVDLPSGTNHLKSRDFEIKDTQYLAGLVAGAFPDTDPSKVAVTGNSYGGGESWLQATQPTFSFPNRCTQPDRSERPPECRLPGSPDFDEPLPVLDLQVAVPKYGWTDLAYGLAPNGHGGGPSGTDIYRSSTGDPQDDLGRGNPIGQVKLSYVNGFFAIGNSRGVFEQGTTTTPSEEGPINIVAWKERLADAGDPYNDPARNEDPIVAQARRGLTEFRGAYYQDKRLAAQADGRKVAIFAIQGWTDDLFPAVEAFRQFKLLKDLDPRWPIEVEVADIGHSRAQNKPATWRRLNGQAFQFLQSNINGSREQETNVTSEPAACARGGDTQTGEDTAARRFTAKTPEGLSNGQLSVSYPPGSTVSPLGALDPNGPRTDAVFGGIFDAIGGMSAGPCRNSESPAIGGYTAVSEPLPESTSYVGLGSVEVPYTFAGSTASLNARVWDVAPNGETLLVTRGTYRLDSAYDEVPKGTLRLPLYGNHWPFPKGHRIRIDLTQVDQPTYRPSNEPSSITFEQPTLRLPTRKASSTTLTGTAVDTTPPAP
jgi:predicted acyl esterase